MFNTAKQACQSSTSLRMMGLIMLTAGVITAVNAGAALFPSQTQALTPSTTDVQVDPFKIMANHKDLPTQPVADLSLIFE